ncbi:MAG: DUF134 domain-containing protein [Proteobacteria bacterium]|nr:DUF134 domain-containing protein [Pseudomonadota bacterium]
MPRPRKWRRVESPPRVTLFKPQGVPARELAERVLPVEGLEALRLVDMEGLDQESASERMDVSRPTLSRVLAAARKTVAEALVLGQALRVEGGDFFVDPGPGPGRGPGWGHGRGWGGRGGRGPWR